MEIILWTLIATVGFQLVCFFIAFSLQIDKITDLAGSLNFIFNVLLSLLLNDIFFTRQYINTALVCVWALRLGGFLVYRVLKREKDERFDEMRSSFVSFLGFWIFQMIWVWTVSLPVVILNGIDIDKDLEIRDYIGWSLWGLGFLLESIADQSKYNYNSKPHANGEFLSTGVWKYSRHPNYAGEILLWIGLCISCSSAFTRGVHYVSLCSPILTFLILMFLSGTNLAEERYNKKYGTFDSYIEYRKGTSVLIPLPNFIYKHLPSIVKVIFCFEFPMYEAGLLDQ